MSLVHNVLVAAMISYFITACLCAYVSASVGYPLWLVQPNLARAWMDLIKRFFGEILVFMNQILSGSRVEVYVEDPELRATLKVDSKGRLHSKFASRAIVISNHQLYSDWVYLWWVAYTSNLHGALTIALKRSFKNLPIFGWGMQLFQFLFLSRNWATDRAAIAETMGNLAKDKSWPTWLVLFPEGTTVSANGVRRCQEYAAKENFQVPQNLLLPRARGLRACLEGLHDSIETLYDFTLYYDGVPAGKFGEDYYSLKNMYLRGVSPPVIRFHVRTFKVADIPYQDETAFVRWLNGLWAEKDLIFERLRDNTTGIEPVRTRVALDSLTQLYGPFNIPMTIGLVSRLAHKAFSSLR